MDSNIAREEDLRTSCLEETLDACLRCGIVFKTICWEMGYSNNHCRNEGPRYCPFCGAPLEASGQT